MSKSKYDYAIKEILEIRDFIHNSEPIIMKYIKEKKIVDLITFEPIEKILEN